MTIERKLEEKGYPNVNLPQLWEELKLEYFTETVRSKVCRNVGDRYFSDVMSLICLSSPFIQDEYEISLSKRDVPTSSVLAPGLMPNAYPIPPVGYPLGGPGPLSWGNPLGMPAMPPQMHQAPYSTNTGPAVPDPATTMPRNLTPPVQDYPVSIGSVDWDEDFDSWAPRPASEPPRLRASEILPWSYEGNRLDLSVPSSRPQSVNAMSNHNDFNVFTLTVLFG